MILLGLEYADCCIQCQWVCDFQEMSRELPLQTFYFLLAESLWSHYKLFLPLRLMIQTYSNNKTLDSLVMSLSFSQLELTISYLLYQWTNDNCNIKKKRKMVRVQQLLYTVYFTKTETLSHLWQTLQQIIFLSFNSVPVNMNMHLKQHLDMLDCWGG